MKKRMVIVVAGLVITIGAIGYGSYGIMVDKKANDYSDMQKKTSIEYRNEKESEEVEEVAKKDKVDFTLKPEESFSELDFSSAELLSKSLSDKFAISNIGIYSVQSIYSNDSKEMLKYYESETVSMATVHDGSVESLKVMGIDKAKEEVLEDYISGNKEGYVFKFIDGGIVIEK